jgi:hypothetical protein
LSVLELISMALIGASPRGLHYGRPLSSIAISAETVQGRGTFLKNNGNET